MYDGGINWAGNWTLDVDAGLAVVSDTTYEQNLGPHVGFGDGRSTTSGSTLTKVGDGALVIARGGIQHYAPGALMDVQEGAVEFNSDPTPNGQPTYYATSAAGQNLEIDVATDAAVAFRSYTWPYSTNWWTGSSYGTDNRHRIKSLSSDGAVVLGGLSPYTPRGVDLDTDLDVPETAGLSDAFLEISDSATFNGIVQILLDASDSVDDYQVDVDGLLSQNGALEILNAGALDVGTYDLFDANSFSGSFSLLLPTGYFGSYNNSNGVLTITQVPEPATLMLLALAMGAILALRRRR
jgi:hypothetical protein